MWEPVEARQLSSVELLRSSPFVIPVKTFQGLPIAYKLNSRHLAGCGSIAGWDSAHSANLFTSSSLPGHLKPLSVHGISWCCSPPLEYLALTPVYPFKLTSDTLPPHPVKPVLKPCPHSALHMSFLLQSSESDPPEGKL